MSRSSWLGVGALLLLVAIPIDPAARASGGTSGPDIRETGGAAATPSASAPGIRTSQPSPTSPIQPRFTTEAPPPADAGWSSIRWQPVPAGDPLAGIRAMTRWSQGYVALGSQTADMGDGGETSSTPVWVSSDGADWSPLDASTFGASGVVVSVNETPSGLVALTLEGGPDQCPEDPSPGCWVRAGPLSAWTSLDGRSWTRANDHVLDLADACDGCGVDEPIVRAGVPGILVVATTDDGQVGAISTDGSTWTALPDLFPGSFEASDVAAFADRFVAVGSRGANHERAAAATSSDGRTWTVNTVPAPGVSRRDGSTMSHVLTAPDGLLAVGSDQLTPGRELWWSSPDGVSWTPNVTYRPLGVWTGGEAGSGLIPRGTVVADGDRILAYRDVGRVAGWTSSDGSSWQPLAVTGATARPRGHWPSVEMTMLPVGLLATAEDGSVRLGVPGA